MTLPISETTPSTTRRPSIWISAAKWTICAVVLTIVGVVLVRQFRGISWSQVHFDFPNSTIAVVCILGVSMSQLVARWTLLIAYGYRLPLRQQLAVSFVPPLGKYLPGGIASVAGAVYMLRRFNVPVAVGLSVTLLLDGLAVVAGLIVSAPMLLAGPVRDRMPYAWPGAVVMICAGLYMMHPRVFVKLANFVLKKANRPLIDQPPTLVDYIWPVLASFMQWIVAGLGLWFMTRAVHGIDSRISPDAASIPLFIASAALAMTISYLAPFSLGGLGVREGVYLLTLGPVIGAQTAAVVVVAMRLIQTLVEVALAGLGALMLRPLRVTVENPRPSRGL